MMKTYVLDADGEPTLEPDLLKWGRWIAGADRRVARDVVPDVGVVSTVFLGMDHSLVPDGPPLVFETMVFVDDDFAGDQQWRYSTRAEALAGHARVLKTLKEGGDLDAD